MTLRLYTVNAFTNGPFTGNPAAYCPLDDWLADEKLQQIAEQNNLSETVFTVPSQDDHHYEIRWFTPKIEVRLCGHATLAASSIIFDKLNHREDIIKFTSKSGLLEVQRVGIGLELNFPKDTLEKSLIDEKKIIEALGVKPKVMLGGKDDLLCVLNDQNTLQNLNPNFNKIAQLPYRGLIVTSIGDKTDFVSRCFYPGAGINEDPATGSAHTLLTPYWTTIFGIKKLTAQQLSNRGGYLNCYLQDDRVLISGQCQLYSIGDIYI